MLLLYYRVGLSDFYAASFKNKIFLWKKVFYTSGFLYIS